MDTLKKYQKAQMASFEHRVHLGKRIEAAKKELAKAWDEVRALDAKDKHDWNALHASTT